MEITFGKPVEQVVQDAMQTYASGNGPNGEPTPTQDYWVKKSDHLAALAAQQEEIDRLKDDLASTEESLEAQRLKYDGCPHKPIERIPGIGLCDTCGCSLDQIGDVCAHHAPALRKALVSIVELRAENAKLQARLDAMSAPVSDEELKEARATIEQLKSYQANYEHATEIERAEKDADTQKLESLLSNSNAERRELRVKIDTLRAMLAARAKTEATG